MRGLRAAPGTIHGLLPVVLLLGSVVSARAAQAVVTVTDDQGAPIEHAVVSLTSPDPALNGPPGKGAVAVMAQQDKQFVPHVLPVRVGTTVSFPNHDDFRHQVYSFSPAKTFQISLYSGDEDKREVFDKPGVVALGCNIHDTMLGYIYVLETGNFAVTGADGVAVVDGLQPGPYRINVWHPRQRAPLAGQEVTVTADAGVTASYTMSLKPPLLLGVPHP
ncbi:MAG: hypothetical protein GC201_13095 [Alphaproteobacteria bacterium]|nr:hypothetical protein [Alphaproteobacteria bacterium]